MPLVDSIHGSPVTFELHIELWLFRNDMYSFTFILTGGHMDRRKVTLMGCLPIAGSCGGAAYGGGDSPGPGGPQIAFYRIDARESLVPA
ncbi:MAG: hypothetical protein AYK19_02810 [Theionarchaea archaeon DG-70-1]|nr:MAG: hypothetical protein AYK19_02810 [Theionarchaea archaeon DG-70-1]